MAITEPYIPKTITVHLGAPDSNAANITEDFATYIKNVASSEIYPTWPEESLRANIYAIITFALNRIYTEYYRSKGYNFDITNSTAYDQAYVRGREIFQPISRIVDEILDSYVVKDGQVQPYYTQYCSGRDTYCRGLSQWGTVTLAERGYTPYQILRYYYGNVGIVENVPVRSNVESYPGRPLKLGSAGEDVRTIQLELNRIGKNYPAIPAISSTDGIFNQQTERAVKKFQEIFNLTQDGIVGRTTWYKIKNIYNGVKNLNDLETEGISANEIKNVLSTVLRQGSRGDQVRYLQYYLNFINLMNNSNNQIAVDGIFGNATKNAVINFQKRYGLDPDGIVGRNTKNKLLDVYGNILNNLPEEYRPYRNFYYPGYILLTGSKGDPVKQLQMFLNTVAQNTGAFSKISVDGVFGQKTENAVAAYQRYKGLNPTGIVDPSTWENLRQDYIKYT